MVRVEGVIKNSVADRERVKKGDLITGIDGKIPEDLIDLHFLTSKPRCTIRVKDRSGKETVFTYNEREGSLGIIPEPVKVRKCKNKCVFCFIHQLPPGLRKSLYIKDEDYRLSFLSGNFVTLSDVTSKELQKIIKYQLSPIYVSIHTTDRDLRRAMLGNPRARDIMETLTRLTGSGITIHGQIVICPGINDGKKLTKTVLDLSRLYPGLQSVAVVPVGLTGHRKGLPPITHVTEKIAGDIVTFVESFARKFRREKGQDFLFASDELYLKYGKPVPSERRYGEFHQIENGVGIVRQFMTSAKKFERIKTKSLRGLSGVAVTGILSYNLVSAFVSRFNGKTGSTIRTLPVENGLFGDTITVSGLLSGSDVLKAVEGKRGKLLFIPSVMLRETRDRFLDDLTPEQIENMTGKRVIVFDPDPLEYYRKCLEIVYN